MNKPSEQPGKIQRGAEARIALCKCGESKKVFGVRFEEDEKAWKYTWAFSIREDAAKREGYDAASIKGNIFPDKDYPGCPYCGKKTFLICSRCHKLSCSIAGKEILTCEWCGLTGTRSAYTGGGISSGGDLG